MRVARLPALAGPALKVLSRGVLVLFACCIANGQPADARLAFEVASIKPSDPAQTIAIRRSGYHLSTSNTSLQMLLTWAYDVHSDRIYGKPSARLVRCRLLLDNWECNVLEP